MFGLGGRVVDAAIDVPIPDAAIDAQVRYADVVFADQPLAYWRFGADSNAIAIDATGNGNDGVYVGAMTLGPGAIGADAETAAMFTGANHVRIGDKLAFPGRAPFTLEAWIKPAPAGNSAGIISKDTELAGTGSMRVGYLLYASNTLIAAERSLGDLAAMRQLAVINVGPPANTWSHVVATYDGISLTLFVDTVVRASASTSIDLPGSAISLAIGGRNGGADERFRGAIDEVAIYPRALTPVEITRHHVIGAR